MIICRSFADGRSPSVCPAKSAPMKKVVALVERDGRARSFRVAKIDHTNIRRALATNVHRSSTLMTDDARWYVNVGR
jgi:hypothetical protein